MHVASPHLRPIIVAVASCALTACTVELGVTAQALTGDPVVDCPVVDPHAIAGHEATFYHCAEETLSCGPDGYLIGYGARYAERFYRHTRPWMSAAGKRWLDATLVCLQITLRERIDATTSCADVRTLAFDSHPECYVDAGFCQLPLSDWFAVAATVDGHDWLSHDAQRQLSTTARACLFGHGLAHRQTSASDGELVQKATRLVLPQRGVVATCCEQLTVTLLDDRSGLEDHEPVHATLGREPVRDDDRGPISHQRSRGLLDER